jgi:hypothetical protein
MIVESELDSLKAGDLAKIFNDGAQAVVVKSREIKSLWDQLIENNDEILPWEARLIDIARNYHGHGDITTSLGDVFYFQPGHHGYIARKLEVSRDPAGKAEIFPPRFLQGSGYYAHEARLIEACCRVVDRIAEALGMGTASQPSYKVAIQRLKYQRRSEEFERLADVAANSLGRWGRAGARVDRNRNGLRGPLRRKGPADVMALLMMAPGLRKIGNALNNLMPRNWMDECRPGETVIEGAHIDHRYFSLLCGQRANMRTEIHDGQGWHPLPIGLDAIVCLPGTLATGLCGVPATLHRVIHTDGDMDTGTERSSNVTFLLGAV